MNEIRLNEFLDMRNVYSATGMFACSGYGCNGSWSFEGMGWSLPDNGNSANWTGAFMFCGYGPGGTLSLGSGDINNRCYFSGLMEMMFFGFSETNNYSLDLNNTVFNLKNTCDYMFANFGFEPNGSRVVLDLSGSVYVQSEKPIFNTVSCLSAVGMFSSLKSPYTSLNTEKVALSKIILPDYTSFANCRDMSYMFYGQTNLTEVNLGQSFYPISCHTMSHMFELCGRWSNSFDLDLGDQFNTSNVEDMEGMFRYTGSNGLKSLDLGYYFNTSKCSNFTEMFYNCGASKLEYLSLGSPIAKFTINSNSSIDKMFYNCGAQTLKTLDLSILTIENTNSTSLEFDTIRKY